MYPNPEIIHLDSALLVINKPAGLLSLPDGFDPSKPHIRAILEPHYSRLWMVHRLDKDTSGVIILARNQAAHQHLNTQFSHHKVEKYYHAVIVGTPAWETITCNASLRPNTGRRKRTAVDPIRGKYAKTEFRVLERFDGHALVEAHPRTGRTHQIRAHLYSLGHPILADPLYGEGLASPLINRLALHAKSLTIIHPTSGEKTDFVSQAPQDIKTALTSLHKVPFR
jgi:RluA family pseudouridine synthase